MIIKSLEHLNYIATEIAKEISDIDYIFLHGEIGTGKTTFTRNLVNYLQKKNKIKQTEVLSPTFNLLYEYEIRDIKLMHYDLYRLNNNKEIEQLDIFNQEVKAIKIIEWPELIQENIYNKLELKFSYITDNTNERNLKISGGGNWSNFKINES